MSKGINKVILVGNMGAAPDIKTMQNNQRVANISVATSEKWKDKNTGEVRENTQWHRVVIFNQNIVNFIEKYTQKGSKLYLEGQLETRKWRDQSGADNYTTEVVIRPYSGELYLLDKGVSQEQQQAA